MAGSGVIVLVKAVIVIHRVPVPIGGVVVFINAAVVIYKVPVACHGVVIVILGLPVAGAVIAVVVVAALAPVGVIPVVFTAGLLFTLLAVTGGGLLCSVLTNTTLNRRRGQVTPRGQSSSFRGGNRDPARLESEFGPIKEKKVKINDDKKRDLPYICSRRCTLSVRAFF